MKINTASRSLFCILSAIFLSCSLAAAQQKFPSESTPAYRNPKLAIEDRVADLIFRAADEQAAPRQAIREIGGAQETRLVREKLDNLPAVPDVIPAGDHFDSQGEQVLNDTRSDAETGSGIFTIGDAQIDLPLRQDIPKAVVDDLAPRRTYDVSDKEDSQ